MTKPAHANNLQPKSYIISVSTGSPTSVHAHLAIIGQKLPPPSRRITLHQNGLKVISAKITRRYKSVVEEHEVIRINHLKKRQEVRLHTSGLLYPGGYTIELEFIAPKIKLKDYQALNQEYFYTHSIRSLLPAIDEPEARAAAEFKVSYSSVKQ